MTPQDFEKLEGLIVKANQSGKQETSGLVDHITKKMEHLIEDSINKNVNGKINSLSKKVDDYIIVDISWKEQDTQWKNNVIPYIETVKKFENFGTIGTTLLKALLLIGGVIGAVYTFIKYLRN